MRRPAMFRSTDRWMPRLISWSSLVFQSEVLDVLVDAAGIGVELYLEAERRSPARRRRIEVHAVERFADAGLEHRVVDARLGADDLGRVDDAADLAVAEDLEGDE